MRRIQDVAEVTCQQILNCSIRITHAAAVEGDACLLQSHPCAAADAAADQNIHIQRLQQAGQSAVAAAVGVHHFRRNDGTVFHFVNFELLGVTEVLEDHTVGISDCDFHSRFAPLVEIPLL